jgi:regulator of sirC expression with transglutaminase-like and TPR domain
MANRFPGALYNERGETKQAIAALEKYLSLAPKAQDAESVRQIIKQLRTQAGS